MKIYFDKEQKINLVCSIVFFIWAAYGAFQQHFWMPGKQKPIILDGPDALIFSVALLIGAVIFAWKSGVFDDLISCPQTEVEKWLGRGTFLAWMLGIIAVSQSVFAVPYEVPNEGEGKWLLQWGGTVAAAAALARMTIWGFKEKQSQILGNSLAQRVDLPLWVSWLVGLFLLLLALSMAWLCGYIVMHANGRSWPIFFWIPLVVSLLLAAYGGKLLGKWKNDIHGHPWFSRQSFLGAG